ncbi:hypothetical protein [Vibrio sp. WXL210]|uniref:hypothetical protein n=1 Tax=Vibrio sp. WXL210 TaxID=3450709 RepID=UPI003EC4E278
MKYIQLLLFLLVGAPFCVLAVEGIAVGNVPVGQFQLKPRGEGTSGVFVPEKGYLAVPVSELNKNELQRALGRCEGCLDMTFGVSKSDDGLVLGEEILMNILQEPEEISTIEVEPAIIEPTPEVCKIAPDLCQ